MPTLYENIANVKQQIKNQCALLNKNENEITIIAASKTVPAQILNTLKNYGISTCGENRVQELMGEIRRSRYPLAFHRKAPDRQG